MPAQTLSKRPLTQLNYEIELAEAEAARLEAERKRVARDAKRAMRQRWYLQAARLTRRPRASLELWPVLLLFIGPVVAGIVFLVVSHLLFGSLAVALLMFLVGVAGGAVAFAALLFRPTDGLLDSAMAEAEAQLKLDNARLTEKSERLSEVKQRLQRLIEERRDQIASGKLQRAALLQRPWKSMGEAEWEDFVVEVCRTLGATVERSGRIDEEDADLIVEIDGRRVAVLTQAEDHHVSSATIQRAIAAKDRHQCGSCAVVINRRFTGAAQDFAQRQACAAIGIGEFPDFVLGKLEL